MSTAQRAAAQGVEVGGSGDRWYLNDAFTTHANIEFSLGRADDRVLFGDWDGDGMDTPMLRRGSTFLVSNANSGAEPERSFAYGRADDEVFVGDWDGDGVDTLAVRRGAIFHIRDTLSDGPADQRVQYGREGDVVLVGDWDGDGLDTFAVRRGAEYHVRSSMTSGPADVVARYGRADDRVLVGDWNGDRRDSFAVRRSSTYYIAHEIRPGEADVVVIYGRADDVAFSGDWDGDGVDTLGVRRVAPAVAPPTSPAPSPAPTPAPTPTPTPTPAPTPPVPADPVDCDGDADGPAGDPALCATMDRTAAELLAAVNAERARASLPPLALDPCLADVAQTWSEEMAWRRLSGGAHNPDLAPDMTACGMRGYAENVGRTWGAQPSTASMMRTWLASSAHRANILRTTVTHIGVGAAPSEQGYWYYVLDLGRR